MMNKKRICIIGYIKYVLFVLLIVVLFLVSNIEIVVWIVERLIYFMEESILCFEREEVVFFVNIIV